MIPNVFIETWSKSTGWQTSVQAEQDLIISRALIVLYNDPIIRNALVFRGGTALNKLFIKPPSRYSEDIDFVQKRPEGIGQTLDAIRSVINPWLGEPKWKITQRCAKLIYRYEAINKFPAKLKIEINITEHFQVLPFKKVKFGLKSEWYNGEAELVTYEIEELMATKLRALYQRRKGRDLFDIWYVIQNGLVDIDRVIEIFHKYCEYNNVRIIGREFIENLEQKKENRDFKSDMNILLPSKLNWNFDKAYQFVIENVISKLP